VDPRTDRGKAYPLLIRVGLTEATSTDSALAAELADLNDRLPRIYANHVARFRGQEKT
jgi:hypothetical protein